MQLQRNVYDVFFSVFFFLFWWKVIYERTDEKNKQTARNMSTYSEKEEAKIDSFDAEALKQDLINAIEKRQQIPVEQKKTIEDGIWGWAAYS